MYVDDSVIFFSVEVHGCVIEWNVRGTMHHGLRNKDEKVAAYQKEDCLRPTLICFALLEDVNTLGSFHPLVYNQSVCSSNSKV